MAHAWRSAAVSAPTALVLPMRGLLMLAALPALIAACTAPSTTPKCEALIDYALVVDNSASLDADAKSKIRSASFCMCICMRNACAVHVHVHVLLASETRTEASESLTIVHLGLSAAHKAHKQHNSANSHEKVRALHVMPTKPS